MNPLAGDGRGGLARHFQAYLVIGSTDEPWDDPSLSHSNAERMLAEANRVGALKPYRIVVLRGATHD